MTTSGSFPGTPTPISTLSPHLTGTLTGNIATTAAVTSAGISMLSAGSAAGLGSMWINTNTGQTHMHTASGNVVVNGAYGIGSNGSSAASKYYNNKANITVAGKGFCIAIDGEDGEEIVRLRNDGKVVWKNGVQLDEGVKAFSSLLRLGVAESAGVGASVREEIRNQVYADLIAMAKEKGSLTEEDLTFDRDSCILVEKLAKSTQE